MSIYHDLALDEQHDEDERVMREIRLIRQLEREGRDEEAEERAAMLESLESDVYYERLAARMEAE